MLAKLQTPVRIIMGLIFFIFGLNGFFNFLPMPPLPEKALGLMMAFGSTGYFFPVLKGTEVIAGALLIAGLYAPLALILLAPIVVQIFLFHTILAPEGAGLAIAVVVLEAFLAWTYKDVFAHVLKRK